MSMFEKFRLFPSEEEAEYKETSNSDGCAKKISYDKVPALFSKSAIDEVRTILKNEKDKTIAMSILKCIATDAYSIDIDENLVDFYVSLVVGFFNADINTKVMYHNLGIKVALRVLNKKFAKSMCELMEDEL